MKVSTPWPQVDICVLRRQKIGKLIEIVFGVSDATKTQFLSVYPGFPLITSANGLFTLSLQFLIKCMKPCIHTFSFSSHTHVQFIS